MTEVEVRDAMQQMSKGKASDRSGMILEMFLFGGDAAISHLTYFFNSIIQMRDVPDNWRESFLVMLHKGGSRNDANNWRPISLLSVSYKIFSRTFYNRIKNILDKQQSEEQFGFRSSRSTTDALIIAESLISKSIEFNVDLWVVSVDLRKAFDRVEHGPLFSALRNQGLDVGYCALLERLYDKQVGILGDEHRFSINRGVRQGDILSPLVFNSVLESKAGNGS